MKRGIGTLGATALALGLRFSILEQADPRLVDSLTALTQAINSACAQVAVRPRLGAVPGVVSCADPRGEVERLSESLKSLPAGTPQAKRDSIRAILMEATVLADARKRTQTALSASVDSLKRDWLAQSWNRPALDIAFAASANTRDSLGRDPKVDVLATWVSGAFPVGEWGQVVYGASGRNARDSVAAPRRWSGGFGAGLYLGSNEFKGYAEARGTWQRDTKTVAEIVAGSELKLFAGLWGQGSRSDGRRTRSRVVGD